uniref:DNA-directed RNA polymerase n=1 Tax=Babesia orientalis TaxID=273649 RepID=A0A0M4NEY2_9APIC|nr:DNA-directed RNA polymerase subunit beta-like subunit, conserved in apicomplexa [Babesia orientalis]ALE29342.1 DNA-directed RNA polymerase subunit beta-like subunit, conserved in apicomplexa [Babesia orientalis]
MIKKKTKTFKLLSIIEISYLEKHLQNMLNVCFEYISNFSFNYNLNTFKSVPFSNSNISVNNLTNLTYLINLYFEKDNFISTLFSFTNLKAKLTLNQLFQILIIKGTSSISGSNFYLLSNLYYGLSLKDLIYSSFSARNSIIDSSLNTAESGYLTRKLIEILREVYIKNNSCKTSYLCYMLPGNKRINIPFLCLNNKSICLKCMYIDYKFIALSGYCKGTISAQALGEPSTQMLLRTFHLGDKTALNNLTVCGVSQNTTNQSLFTIKNNSYYTYISLNIYSYYCKEVFNKLYLYKTNICTILIDKYTSFKFVNCIKILTNAWAILTVNKCVKHLYKTTNLYSVKLKKYFII